MKLRNLTPTFIEYHALRGSYGRVIYFVTKTSLRDTAENLTLAPQDALTFSERIQRVVNTKRVEREIVPYLEHNDLRFFNALVCILLPDSNSMQGFWDFEEYKDDQGIPIGGLGKLKIVKEVGRIVLDGQHRFVALQQYWKAKRDATGPDTDVDIAIVFVIVDELGRIGKKTPDVRTKTIGAVRNLFAVLNKTARSVDKTTLLLIDDTNIFNVMTRSLIEQKLVDELVIKWTGGDNLQPRDPYFSTINVLKDALIYYLSDFSDELSMECGTDTDRDELIKKYYEKTPGFEVSAAKGVSYLFEQTGPVKNWRKHLRLAHVTLMPQPESMHLDRTQAKTLEAARTAQLCFTVAGQKVMFRAMIEAFRHQPRRDQAALEKVGKKVSGLIDRGFFSRKPEDANPFFGLMFDAKGRMSWAEGPVDLARRILAIAAGSPADRKSVCSDYEAHTSRPSSIVTEYWKRAGA
ncbi:MAG TPA: DNA sulfur modification protein DndB [Chthoniobacterales bacterium]|nr:DNA sulfur modification protein DndB [Chthoniobacterales bacterium]